eukprot:3419798-Rhodomonas_salina.1
MTTTVTLSRVPLSSAARQISLAALVAMRSFAISLLVAAPATTALSTQHRRMRDTRHDDPSTNISIAPRNSSGASVNGGKNGIGRA